MKIVCIGDSLTYGYGVPRRESWVSLCAQESGHAFVGRGVNGDTTGGMLARFSADVLPERPDAVLMMGGANDRFFSGFFGAAQANIMALAHRCCGCGMAPLIGIPIPLCPPIRDGWCELVDASFDDDYTAYCDALRHMSRVFGFGTVDFRAALLASIEASGEALRAFYLDDGLHPNARGHRLMADILQDCLPRLL